ncbi:MAG: hypothetical protein ABH851_01035 [Methanobacteriota archaeon]
MEVKDLEVLTRYFIPGYVVLFPVALIILFLYPQVGEFTGVIFLVMGFTIGYFIHQVYLFLFEGKRWPYEHGGYTGVEQGGRRKIMEKVAETGHTITKTQAYNVWEYFFYSNSISDALRGRVQRSHRFIHSQRSVSLACILGIIIIAVSIPYLASINYLTMGKVFILLSIAVFYAGMAALLILKAQQTLNLHMRFEEFIVKKNWDNIKEILEAAEYLDETGKKK